MRILLVDDDELNLMRLETILRPHYDIFRAKDGDDALLILEKEKIDLVLLDIIMPGMSGFEVARRIKTVDQIPVILLTTLKEKEDIIKGLESGADEFLSKPILKEELLLRIKNILKPKQYQNTLEELVDKRLEDLKEVLKESVELNREMVFRLLVASEYRDDQTGKHITRVGKYSQIIGEAYGYKGEFLEVIENAAKMHDLGKIGIPDRILLKPGKLTPEEFETMKSHTVIGASILEGSSFPLLKMSYEIALTHHEKWDGTGYPYGSKGEAIPVSGRIVALSDVFDALLSHRPYKPPFTWEKSIEIIKQGRGTHFDPRVVDSFFSRINDIQVVYTDYHDSDNDNPRDRTRLDDETKYRR
jgi:putative two-component system response regulator